MRLHIGKVKASEQRPGFIPNPKLRLLDQVSEVMRFKHYSIRTEETYREWIKRFILFHWKRHPREMGTAEVDRFLSDLAVNGRVAASTQNQALDVMISRRKARRVTAAAVTARILASTESGTGLTLSGLGSFSGPTPRVARSSQPRAGMRNPFGVFEMARWRAKGCSWLMVES